MFLKNRNIISKMKRSKVTDYAALNLKNKESADVNNRHLKHHLNLSSLLTLISRNAINYVKDPFCASRLILYVNFSPGNQHFNLKSEKERCCKF